MSKVHFGVCNFCDSICGLEIEHDGLNILSICFSKNGMLKLKKT